MKVTGAELMEFYREWPFGDDFYHDGGVDDDFEALNPTEKYDLDDEIGFVEWQGDGPEPRHVTYKGQSVRVGARFLESMFEIWRGDSVTLAVTVPSGDVDDLVAVAKEHGWKVRR